MKRNSTFISRAILILFGLSVVASGRARADDAASSPDKSKGMNVLIIGHSLTGNLVALSNFAPEIGHPDHKQQLYMILGAGIRVHYDRMTEELRKKYFESGMKLDALILSARDTYPVVDNIPSDEGYAPKFAAEAFKNNPKCQIFIYGNWPGLDEDFNNPSFGHTEKHIENVAAAVDKAFPNAPKTRLMPCSLLIRELGLMADAGEIRGIKSRFELCSDLWGHPSQLGAYAINMLVMAELYKESPLNYPANLCPKNRNGAQPNPQAGDIQVPEETAVEIKRFVWDILQTYPPAGMPPSLVITSRRLDPAIVGQPYKTELKALNAKAPCAWSLAKGRLPAGITLSTNGLLAGQSTAAGQYPVTIQLISGSESCERPLTLSVCEDSPLIIPDQLLPGVSLDSHVTQGVKVDGGIGAVTWSVSHGKLPYGIMLSPSGILIGTPGEEGEFTFKVKVTDSHPAGARSAEREFQWKIGPAKPDTLGVKYVVTEGTDITHLADIHSNADIKNFAIPADSVLKIDGKLDEPFWKLDQSIEIKAKGTPTKKASFAAVWTASSDGNGDPKIILPGVLYVGESPGRTWKLIGRQLVLAVKVLDGPKGKTPKDGIHIFINGNHDKTHIYSSNDTHFFIPRDLKGRNAQTICGKVNWFTDAKVEEIEGGYVMEIKLGGNNYFAGEGNWLSFGCKSVYGLDVAVDEGEEGNVSQQVWRGDAKDDTDTSQFGTIVLTSQPAMGTEPTLMPAK